MSENKILSDNLIKVMEDIFRDLRDNLDAEARSYHICPDASTALYHVSSSINMMDFPYIIRDALGVPHPTT